MFTNVSWRISSICGFFLLIAPAAFAQEIKIDLGKNRLTIEEYFTISIKLRNQALQEYGNFPEIEGFKKSSRFSTTARIATGSKTIIEQTITQNYAALQEGIFVLRPFAILVNQRNIYSKGTSITIQPNEPAPGSIPPVTKEAPIMSPKESKSFKSESYLVLETNKHIVYAGEGLYIELAFYLAAGEQGQLDFYSFTEQFPEIIKKLRQPNAWEEGFEADPEIKPDTVVVNQKNYLRFNIYRRLYYPLTAKPLVFEPVSLVMARRPEAGYAAAPAPVPADLHTFTSLSRKILVKPLPPHPLREEMPVGQYRLQEGIDRTSFKTGQSFTYRFEVQGEGNLSTLTLPLAPSPVGLDIYPPEIKYNDKKYGGRALGSRSFRYSLLAKAPGNYDLSKIFRLIYFNPKTEQYDTLRSGLILQVSGAKEKLVAVKPGESDPFYKIISTENNDLVDLNEFNEIKFYTNVVILFLICITLFLFFKMHK